MEPARQLLLSASMFLSFWKYLPRNRSTQSHQALCDGYTFALLAYTRAMMGTEANDNRAVTPPRHKAGDSA